MLARVLSSLAWADTCRREGTGRLRGHQPVGSGAAQIEPALKVGTALVPNTQQELPGLFRS
jgi:hypothetical protein